MRQEQSMDWIEYMADQVYLEYRGRKVVVWGSYEVADSVKGKLKEKYGIDTAFYVDGDKLKVDGGNVFSPECLDGKANQYYVVVPIGFYPAVRERLIQGGYRKDADYCYFCDCALRQEPDYYEDAHGNKIIGNYQGLKFVFSGFHSVIKIGEGVKFRETTICLHNGAEVVLGEGVRCLETDICIYNGVKFLVGDRTRLEKSRLRLHHFSELSIAKEALLRESSVCIGGHSVWEINRGCELEQMSIFIGKEAKVLLGEEVRIIASKRAVADWRVRDSAEVQIGRESRFSGYGYCDVCEKAFLEIGRKFTIVDNYKILLPHSTSINIGEDCMFSWNIVMDSSDDHSIFNVITGENINSTYNIAKGRRIVIGNHVWVGNGACILYHTRIGDGSIVGAMSLVKGKVLNNCIAAGNPARVIKKNIAWSRKNGAEDIRECGQAYVNYTEKTDDNMDIDYK